ncbi:MAG TPA: glycosyltransferase [Longimicrobiales bacterium]|nr:glycosyltransferase [Longimicrobiales bacterium]
MRETLPLVPEPAAPTPAAPPAPVAVLSAPAADAVAAVDISVVLCTRDRCQSLRRTLASFTRQVVPAGLVWELVLVDNGSTDATADVIAEFGGRLPIRCVLEPQPGASRARNAGIRASRGDIVAFTDDDCLPDPDWLERLWLEFRAEPELAGLGGRVELADPADRPVSIRTSARRDRLAGPDLLFGGIPGCNTAFVRCVFVSVGLYDPGFGPGSPLPAAEHSDLAYRVFRAGFRVDYVPELVVRHAHGRRSDDAVGEANRRYIVGRGGFYTKHILRGDVAILRSAYWELSAAMRALAERMRGDTPVQPVLRDVRYLFVGMLRGVPLAWRRGGRLAPAPAAPGATAPGAAPAETARAAAAPVLGASATAAGATPIAAPPAAAAD